MDSTLQRACDLLRHSAYSIALTGAGISTPSGIPDFRSPHAGLWTQVDPLEVASLWAFHEHPQDFYRWFVPILRKMLVARPNTAHEVLAQMESAGLLKSIVTQNVDSLHQQAGSRAVHEVHGHARTATCLDCGQQVAAATLWPDILAGGPPPHCSQCGGLLKPDVVLFGEPLPYEAISSSQEDALQCEVMLIIGTSLEVMPAADLPLLAKRRGARLIIINLTATPLDDYADVLIRGGIVNIMGQLQLVLRE